MGPEDPRPIKDVEMHGATLKALWDSGSVITLISKDAFSKLAEKPAPLPVPKHLSIRAANGSQMPILYYCVCKFIFRGRVMFRPTFVVPHLNNDCIIGGDTMKAEGIILKLKEGEVLFDSDLLPSVSDKRDICLITTRDCKVAEMSEMFVPCKVSRLCPGSASMHDAELSKLHGEFLVEEKLLPTLACIEPSLINIKHGLTKVMFRNQQVSPADIPKGTIVEVSEFDKGLQVNSIRADEAGQPSRPARKFHVPQVDYSKIPVHHRQKFITLVNKYSHVLDDTSTNIGQCKIMPQRITLKDPTKIACTPPYRCPPALQPVVDQYVDNLLKAGIIRPSMSSFSSPLMLVKKPKADPSRPIMEQYRVVHDFRKLNANTVKDSYPMQNLYQLIDEVASARIASVLDLRQGFHIQQLSEESRKYTGFPVPGRGLFEYCRSPQGLINSSSCFQRLLDFILRGMKNVRVYIDDIVIFSDDYESHWKTLNEVLERLNEHGFKCSVKKLQLACGKIEYLGYEIEPGKAIRPGLLKCKAIAEWPMPDDISKIRQFLGLCSFFRRTIQNFARIANPLTKLTRKDSGYKKGTLPLDAQDAFRLLRHKLMARPTLRPVNFSKTFILTTDASTTAIGAVLSQKDASGVEFACAYYSRSLNEAERKRPSYYLEHLAMVSACRHFRPYLLGKEFIIRTDHKPLLALNKTQGHAATERLQAELQDFDPYKIEYMKGSDMIADGLSRSAQAAVNESTATFMYTPLQLKSLQKEDPFCKAFICVKYFGSWPGDPKLLALLKRFGPNCVVVDGLVYHQVRGFAPTPVAPAGLRIKVMQDAHDSRLAGHMGYDKTLRSITQRWWWPGVNADVMQYCRGCHACAQVNVPHHDRPTPMQRMEPVSRPFQRVHIDLLQLPSSIEGHKYALLIVDAFTKWTEAVALPSKEAAAVARATAQQWIARYGVPEKLVSDQGSEFTAEVFKELLGILKLKHVYTTVGHPESNGLVERANRSLLNYFRKYLEDCRDWNNILQFGVFAHNSAFHSSIKTTPFKMMFLNDPLLPHSFLDPPSPDYNERDELKMASLMKMAYSVAAENSKQAFLDQKRQHDMRARSRIFEIGDRVYIKTSADAGVGKKLNPKYKGPFFIVKKVQPYVFSVRANKGTKIQNVHAQNLKHVPFSQAMFIQDTMLPPEPGGQHSQQEQVPRSTRAGPMRSTRSSENRLHVQNDDHDIIVDDGLDEDVTRPATVTQQPTAQRNGPPAVAPFPAPRMHTRAAAQATGDHVPEIWPIP